MKTSDKVFIVFLMFVITVTIVSHIKRQENVERHAQILLDLEENNKKVTDEISRSLAEIKKTVDKLEGK